MDSHLTGKQPDWAVGASVAKICSVKAHRPHMAHVTHTQPLLFLCGEEGQEPCHPILLRDC